MQNNESVFSESNLNRSDELDINEILKEAQSENIEEEKEEPTTSATVKPVLETKKSPLEMLKEQQKNQSSGIILNNEDMKEDGPKKNIVYNDDRMASIEESIAEYDVDLEKRKKITVIQKPMTQVDYIMMMDEIDAVTTNPDGSVSINLVDKEGNRVKPKFIKVREKDEPEFDYSVLTDSEKNALLKGSGEEGNESNGNTNDKSDKDDSDENEETNEISPEKKRTVEILIDKTGLGADFMFTDEEKEKIAEAESIKLNEVKLIDINTIRAKRSQKSFQDVIKSYDLSGERVTICFPASGFKAQMKGLTYGEYSDILLSMENVRFDQHYKRLSIIYNKMTNISTGPFKDFEDFLKHFAYVDIPLAIYGMFVATEKEVQEIPLRCGDPKCGKSFDWKYNTRSILRLDRCEDEFLEAMKRIATADATEYDTIAKEAAVNTSKYIELPESKFICEVGVISAYEYLYNVVPLENEETFGETFTDDVNGVYKENRILLNIISSIQVPDGEGGYIECTTNKEILDALYNISATEVQILATLVIKVLAKWNIVFSFGEVQCPHCKTITKNMDMSIDELVFQTYNRLMSTEIDLNSVQDF
jgi:hypothetical protein